MKTNGLSVLSVILTVLMFIVLFNQEAFAYSSIILIVLIISITCLTFLNTGKKKQ
ncbi:hypothetical protein [Exiguobacterium acetylicum]|uniref:hypothetical protein n=1 Tax=Exiguobacterium acetylicum TaxID=41170 RepID=UPI000A43601D|nr:hypothetical protein [Exiguobacterium acetylicum]UKS56848.1 hypothetical protein K6T22_04310 [Exiguobacterium acetylicum]